MTQEWGPMAPIEGESVATGMKLTPRKQESPPFDIVVGFLNGYKVKFVHADADRVKHRWRVTADAYPSGLLASPSAPKEQWVFEGSGESWRLRVDDRALEPVGYFMRKALNSFVSVAAVS